MKLTLIQCPAGKGGDPLIRSHPYLQYCAETKEKLISRAIACIITVVLTMFPLGFAAFAKDSAGKNTKVFLIGIDGLEWSVINELVKEGKMPAFGELMESGTYGNLSTLLDYPSPGLWTAIATGKSPASHGITSFMVHEKGRYGTVSPMSYHRKVKALWNIISERDKKVGVINYFCTEPPEAVNGFIVPFPITESRNTFPDSLNQEVNFCKETNAKKARELYSDFQAYYDYKDSFSKEIKDNLGNGGIWRISVIAPYLYRRFNKNSDLLIVYVRETDVISHTFWKFMEPDFFQHKSWGLTPENIKKYGNIIKDMYVMIDRLVGKLIKDIADENTVIIICSDHGFTHNSYGEGEWSVAAPILFKNLDLLLEKLGFLQFKTDSGSGVSLIDFGKTYAYHYQIDEPGSFPNAFISLNLKGRQPNGIVEPGREYAKLKKDLIAALSNLKITETGKGLFNDITELNEPQKDIKVTIKSDIDLLRQHVRVGGSTYPLNDFYVSLDSSGTHSDPGVFIIYGKNIRKGKIITGGSVLDIAPTILHLLSLPVAKDMEGNVLAEALDAAFLRRNPIKYIDTYEVPGGIAHRESGPGLMNARELEKLRSLGYVH